MNGFNQMLMTQLCGVTSYMQPFTSFYTKRKGEDNAGPHKGICYSMAGYHHVYMYGDTTLRLHNNNITMNSNPPVG